MFLSSPRYVIGCDLLASLLLELLSLDFSIADIISPTGPRRAPQIAPLPPSIKYPIPANITAAIMTTSIVVSLTQLFDMLIMCLEFSHKVIPETSIFPLVQTGAVILRRIVRSDRPNLHKSELNRSPDRCDALNRSLPDLPSSRYCANFLRSFY